MVRLRTDRRQGACEQYERYRPQMKTGDVLAFSGKSRTSRIVRWATRSPYSHVALLWRARLPGGFGASVMLIESTTLVDLPDALTRRVHKGVQLHFVSQRVSAYDGRIWWVPLREPLRPTAQRKMEAWLRQTHCKQVPYDLAQAIGAGFDLLDALGLANEPDFSALFCSELVARALQVAGVLDPGVNASELTPADVVALPCFERPVRLK